MVRSRFEVTTAAAGRAAKLGFKLPDVLIFGAKPAQAAANIDCG